MEYTLITGACGGIGGAFCEVLAERQEPLFCTGRSEERLRALAFSLKERFPALEVRTFPCDLQSEESRLALYRHFEEEHITFKRLVYVAGVDTQMAFEKYDEKRILMQTRANFEGAVSLIREVLSRSSLDGNTEILTVGSVSGVFPMPYFALYSATKRALEHFSIALRHELKGRAKVTCVRPGSVPTRKDIVENISSHGAFGKISVCSPRKVAKVSLKEVKHNRRKKTVGWGNRCILFFTRLLPPSLRERAIARIWKRTEKDFFA